MLVTVKPWSGRPNSASVALTTTALETATLRKSMTVAAAPSLEIRTTPLLTASAQSHPASGVSSCVSPNVPLRFRSP